MTDSISQRRALFRNPVTVRDMISWAETSRSGQELVYLRARHIVSDPELADAARKLREKYGLMLFQRPTGMEIEGLRIFEYVMRKLPERVWEQERKRY